MTDLLGKAREYLKASSNHAIKGDRETALAKALGAVEILQNASNANRDQANALKILSMRHAALNQKAEAKDRMQQAVNTYQDLPSPQLEAARPELADAFKHLGNCHAVLGEREQALVASRERVDILRTLDHKQETAELAEALTSLAKRHEFLNNNENALKALNEALEIYKKLHQSDPETHTFGLALTLSSISTRCTILGNHEEALNTATEILHILKPRLQQEPEQYQGDMEDYLEMYLQQCELAGKEPDQSLVNELRLLLPEN